MDENINRLVHQALGFERCSNGIKDCGCERPDYTTDLNAAFRFAEKLIADGANFTLMHPTSKAERGYEWWAQFYGTYALDDSPARAVCLAGLAAIGEKV